MRTTRRDARAGQAVLSVEDTGSDIPADALPHIFDWFHKSADSRGTGLGLAIARSLVRAHGGEIAAHSAPGQGTAIRVTMPLHPSSLMPVAPARALIDLVAGSRSVRIRRDEVVRSR